MIILKVTAWQDSLCQLPCWLQEPELRCSFTLYFDDAILGWSKCENNNQTRIFHRLHQLAACVLLIPELHVTCFRMMLDK